MAGVAMAQGTGGSRRILFIRGGSGTGGLGVPNSDDQLSDLFDFSTAAGNHGFGELGALLTADGFVVEQMIEGPISNPAPVDLASLPIAQYSVIVFGSNNASYSASAALLVRHFVEAGGGALFISDSNWGLDYGYAPSSDQTFLDRLDLVMNQDYGTYTLSRAAGDFVINGVDMGTHPILAGPDGIVGTADDVNEFDGEGVSPATVTHLLPGVNPFVLAKAKDLIHVNDSSSSGSFRPPTRDDGALVVAQVGAGRIACTFDRNTFFNTNGQGTSLARYDNRQYAHNLFAWLAGPLVRTYGAGKVNSLGLVAEMGWSGNSSASSANFVVQCTGAVPGNLGLAFYGPSFAQTPFMGGELLVSGMLVRLPAQVIDPNGGVSYRFAIPAGFVGAARYFQFWYRDPFDPAGFGVGLSNGLRACFTP
jgi:hypothetical protein